MAEQLSRRERQLLLMRASVRGAWRANSSLILLYSGLVAAVTLSYLAQLLVPGFTQSGELTRTNFWGVVSSIFIHGSPSHLEANVESLFWLTLSVVVLAEVNRDLFAASSRTFLFWTPFLAAIVSNMAFYILAPQATSFGASGVVYAALGLAVALAFAGLVPELTAVVKRQPLSKAGRFKLEINLLLSVPFAGLAWASPGGFLGVGTGANVFVHGLSFTICLLLGYVYFTLKRHSIMILANTVPFTSAPNP